MKMMTAAAVIALTTATAAYAQSGNNAPITLTPPSNQGQQVQNNASPPSQSPGAKAHSKAGRTAEMKGSRSQQDPSENRITEELNRQQAQMASKFDNGQNGPGAPQTATKPDSM